MREESESCQFLPKEEGESEIYNFFLHIHFNFKLSSLDQRRIKVLKFKYQLFPFFTYGGKEGDEGQRGRKKFTKWGDSKLVARESERERNRERET